MGSPGIASFLDRPIEGGERLVRLPCLVWIILLPFIFGMGIMLVGTAGAAAGMPLGAVCFLLFIGAGIAGTIFRR